MLSALFDFLESEFGLNNLLSDIYKKTSTSRRIPHPTRPLELRIVCVDQPWVNMWIVSVWTRQDKKLFSLCRYMQKTETRYTVNLSTDRTEIPFTWENHNTLVETIQNFFREEKTCSGICRLLALA